MPPRLEQILVNRWKLKYREAQAIVLDARNHLDLPSNGPWTEELLKECVCRIQNSSNSSLLQGENNDETTTKPEVKKATTSRQVPRPVNRGSIQKAKGPRVLRANPSMEDLADMLGTYEEPKNFRRNKRDKQQQQEQASAPNKDSNNSRHMRLKREQEPLWPGSEHSANLMHSLHGLPLSSPHCSVLQQQDFSSRSSRLWNAEDGEDHDDLSFAEEERIIVEVPAYLSSNNPSRPQMFPNKKPCLAPQNKTSSRQRAAPFWSFRRRLAAYDEDMDDGLIDTSGSCDEMSDCSDPAFFEQQDLHANSNAFNLRPSGRPWCQGDKSNNIKPSNKASCLCPRDQHWNQSENDCKTIKPSSDSCSFRPNGKRWEQPDEESTANRLPSLRPTGQHWKQTDEECTAYTRPSLRPTGQHWKQADEESTANRPPSLRPTGQHWKQADEESTTNNLSLRPSGQHWKQADEESSVNRPPSLRPTGQHLNQADEVSTANRLPSLRPTGWF